MTSSRTSCLSRVHCVTDRGVIEHEGLTKFSLRLSHAQHVHAHSEQTFCLLLSNIEQDFDFDIFTIKSVIFDLAVTWTCFNRYTRQHHKKQAQQVSCSSGSVQ